MLNVPGKNVNFSKYPTVYCVIAKNFVDEEFLMTWGIFTIYCLTVYYNYLVYFPNCVKK